MPVPVIVIDQGAFVSILSPTTWKYFSSPQLVPVTQNLFAFNRGYGQLSGILPQLPINLGGNIVYIDVMVVQGPLDFNLLLGHDHVYAMGYLISSLFHVMCFSHEGRIVTIDQLLFVGPNLTPNQPCSVNGPYVQVVSPPPQVK